jgi:DNA-binding Xre family transcriptional regulator
MAPSSRKLEPKGPKDPGRVTFRLGELLESKGIRQIQLANASGLHRVSVSRLVTDTRQIDLDTLARLCYALNITDMNELLQWVAPPDYEPPELRKAISPGSTESTNTAE